MASAMPQGVIPPPLGVTPDFEHPMNKNAGTVYVLASVGIIVSTLCLIMRIYTKLRIQQIFGPDDICIIIAWACSMVTQFVIVYNYHEVGEGIHLWDMTIATYSAYQKFILVASVFYVPAMGFAKLSLLVLYHHLSPQKRLRTAIYIVMVVVVGYSTALIFTLIFSCHPIQRGWVTSITTGYCINRPAVYLATAIINIVTDLVILVIPIPMVLALKIPKIQKVGLMLMFVVGSATVITSVVRLVTLLPLLTSVDQPWAIAVPAMWIMVEVNLVIICGCLPTIRQFLRRIAPKLIGEGSSCARRIGTYSKNPQPFSDSYILQDSSATTRHSRYHFSRKGSCGRDRIRDDPELADTLARGVAGNRTQWPMRKQSDDSENTIVSPVEAVVRRESLKGGY